MKKHHLEDGRPACEWEFQSSDFLKLLNACLESGDTHGSVEALRNIIEGALSRGYEDGFADGKAFVTKSQAVR